MKFLALILSVYILALNLAPCADGGEPEATNTLEMIQVDQDAHDHAAMDLCSPFCACHCCHMHATYFNLFEFSAETDEITTKIFLHFDNLGKDIPDSILQPPRV